SSAVAPARPSYVRPGASSESADASSVVPSAGALVSSPAVASVADGVGSAAESSGDEHPARRPAVSRTAVRAVSGRAEETRSVRRVTAPAYGTPGPARRAARLADGHPRGRPSTGGPHPAA